MAKLVNIDTPNPALPKDVQDAIAMQNARETKQILAKQGVNELISKDTTDSKAFTAASWVDWEIFTLAFATSGGYVEITFRTNFSKDANNNGYMKLLVDDKEMDNLRVASTALTIVPGLLLYRGNLESGKHVIKIQALCTGGTFTAGAYDRDGFTTRLRVTETIF